ncbi:MAG: permease prefix domain 1-containing protein [Edaphobacter sp.]
MTKPFYELRERLLRVGIAPRHVRRYLNELADHLADLTAEEEGAGRSRTDAESAALTRLGGIENLAKAMTEHRQFQSWSVRAPWATFGLTPLLLLAAIWCVALFLLWSGWHIFLPGADTPFGSRPGQHRIFEIANVYFQIDRALYFAAPILVGWGIGIIALRQRLRLMWPTAGLVLIALIGGTAQVHASRTAVPTGLGHIRMDFTLGSTMPFVPYGLFHSLMILSLTALPYLIWRFFGDRISLRLSSD